MVSHAQEFLASGREPAAPKDAATVVLLRQARSKVEVYLLRRHSQMVFAPGMYVFPGGSVDGRDLDTGIAWAGRSADGFGTAFGCAPETARGLVCAAARETFEESGVLLAGPTSSLLVPDTEGESWESDRAALVDRDLSFGSFLRRRSLVLRADLLAPWAHWVTPEFEPRRYDTRFFVAVLPGGQTARDVSGEADRVAWQSPAEALAAADAARIEMLPPTYVTLRELADYRTVEEVMAAAERRTISANLPSVRLADGGSELVWGE